MSMGGGGEVSASPGEVAQAQLSQQQWEDYKDRFVPLETEFFGVVDDIKDSRGKAMGAASADAESAYSDASDVVKTRALASGVNPNSGKFMATLGDLSLEKADARSKGVVNADAGTDARYLAGLDQIVGMGRGVARDASIGYGQMASIGANNARSDALADATKSAALYDAAGTVAGAAGRYSLENYDSLGSAKNTLSGSTYGTKPLSEQSRMLAIQDWGF